MGGRKDIKVIWISSQKIFQKLVVDKKVKRESHVDRNTVPGHPGIEVKRMYPVVSTHLMCMRCFFLYVCMSSKNAGPSQILRACVGDCRDLIFVDCLLLCIACRDVYYFVIPTKTITYQISKESVFSILLRVLRVLKKFPPTHPGRTDVKFVQPDDEAEVLTITNLFLATCVLYWRIHPWPFSLVPYLLSPLVSRFHDSHGNPFRKRIIRKSRTLRKKSPSLKNSWSSSIKQHFFLSTFYFTTTLTKVSEK